MADYNIQIRQKDASTDEVHSIYPVTYDYNVYTDYYGDTVGEALAKLANEVLQPFGGVDTADKTNGTEGLVPYPKYDDGGNSNFGGQYTAYLNYTGEWSPVNTIDILHQDSGKTASELLDEYSDFLTETTDELSQMTSMLTTINTKVDTYDSYLVPFGGADEETSQEGTQGLVPAPLGSQERYYLKGDGSWSIVNATDVQYDDESGASQTLNVTLGAMIKSHASLESAMDDKQDTITGGATTITDTNLTASRALVSNSSGKVAVSAVTSTELEYLDGVTSAIQTQLNGKLTTSHLTNAFTTAGAAGYIRFPNTKMQITFQRWTANVVITAAWGSIYESTAVITAPSFPASFSAAPVVVRSVGSNSRGSWIQYYANPSTTSAGSWYMCSASSSSSTTTMTFYVIAIGSYS